MKEIDQTKLMETLFFGSDGPDAISYIDMFLNGGGVFEFMFEQHKNVEKLELKQMFARDSKAFVLGDQLNKSVLESLTKKGGKIVTGPYLYDWAKKSLAKSLPFLLKYVDEKGEPKASGSEMEGVIRSWLTDYYA